MDRFVEIASAVACLLIALLLASTCYYRSQYQNTALLLDGVRVQIKNQNAEAEATLARLTAERNEKQIAIDRAYQSQEKKDAQAKTEIDRLADELRARPVRVRIQCPGGESGGSTTNHSSASADNSDGDTGTTYGVLPAVNSERLANAMKEVEQLSAAYRSCRASLIPGGI